MKKRKRRLAAIISLCLVLALVVGGFIAFLVYTGGYAKAGLRTSETVADATLRIEDHGRYTSVQTWGSEATTGYIFYPGGLVDEAAYLPYLAEIARQGYYCAVVTAPFHLALLGSGRAGQVIEDNPEIDTWVVGGHSLGGVAAASWLEKNPDSAAGIVLLASYPTADLSNSGLLALSITATNDQVLNWESWNEGRMLLPPNTRFAEIDGGNHAGFGDYGAQEGDGQATISSEEQERATVAHTTALLAEAAGDAPVAIPPEGVSGEAA